jgi:hypothetical protein
MPRRCGHRGIALTAPLAPRLSDGAMPPPLPLARRQLGLLPNGLTTKPLVRTSGAVGDPPGEPGPHDQHDPDGPDHSQQRQLQGAQEPERGDTAQKDALVKYPTTASGSHGPKITRPMLLTSDQTLGSVLRLELDMGISLVAVATAPRRHRHMGKLALDRAPPHPTLGREREGARLPNW